MRTFGLLAAVLGLAQPLAGQVVVPDTASHAQDVRALSARIDSLTLAVGGLLLRLDSLAVPAPLPAPVDTTPAPTPTPVPPPATGAVRFSSDWSGAGLTDGGKWTDYGWGRQMTVGTRAGLTGNALRVAQGGGGDLMEASFTPPNVGQTLVIEFTTVAEPGGGGVDHGLQSNIDGTRPTISFGSLTELGVDQQDPFNAGIAHAWGIGEDTTPDATLSGSAPWGILALEIDNDGGGAPTGTGFRGLPLLGVG